MPPIECTKRDASYCPCHGYCECRNTPYWHARGSSQGKCPLHAWWSDHGAEDVQTVWGKVHVPPVRVAS